MEFVNQYSFTMVAGTLIILFSILIFRGGVGQREIIALVALIIGFMVAYWFFNPGESSTGGGERTKAAIGSGKPVLLEFQSPY
jgi:uncharacterized membrane protein